MGPLPDDASLKDQAKEQIQLPISQHKAIFLHWVSGIPTKMPEKTEFLAQLSQGTQILRANCHELFMALVTKQALFTFTAFPGKQGALCSITNWSKKAPCLLSGCCPLRPFLSKGLPSSWTLCPTVL